LAVADRRKRSRTSRRRHFELRGDLRQRVGTQTCSLCGKRGRSPLMFDSGKNIRWPHRQNACVPLRGLAAST
jgi:hypothetical protein